MSDSKENVDVLKMYGEDSTTKRDEFLKNLAYTEILFNNKFMPMGSGCRHFVFSLSIQQIFPLFLANNAWRSVLRTTTANHRGRTADDS